MAIPALSLILVAAAPPQTTDDATFFEREVRPILEARCFECHGAEGRAKGGLRISTRAAFLAGGDSGPTAAADGTLDASLFLEAIGYEDELLQMPPSAKLSGTELATLRDWIARGVPYGAADPRETNGGGAGELAAEEPHGEPRITRGDGLTGWAYRAVSVPEVPEVVDEDGRPLAPIDAFVRARLAAVGLDPSPPADERTLVRRVHLDLLGLPPTPEEVEAYVQSDDPGKWSALVERLLASPHYGERWGRHWLDVVRYAETNGFERDGDKPNIWRYRDWVVDAFNRDLPYDRFVLEQLAGDELRDRTPGSQIASGYLRLAQWDDEPGAGVLQGRYDVLDDIVSTTGQVFLGSTIGCARCHDHKADPFDAEHYYQFMAFFHGLTDMSKEGTQIDISSPEDARVADEAEAALRARIASLADERRALVGALQRAQRAGGGDLPLPAGPLRELRYRFYRDTWSMLPDFEMFRPEERGTLAAGYVDLAPRTRDNAIGFVQEGLLRVPATGVYEIRVRADDGARVLLGGEPVVVLDGLGDEPRRAVGRAELAAGDVDLRVEWFNASGAPTLDVAWRRVDDARWRYTLEEPAADWLTEGFDATAWSLGEGGFGTEGTPGARVGTQWSSERIWLRRTFRWDPAQDADPCLVLHHDEDVDVYLNGVLALRRGGYARGYLVDELGAAARAALRPGENTLAVTCAQTVGGQFVDVALVPRAMVTAGARLADVAQGFAPLSTPRAAPSEEELARLFETHGDALLGDGTHARYTALVAELRAARAERVPRPRAFAARERGGEVPPLAVHVRGNASSLGAPVEPAVPAFLGAVALPAIEPTGESSGRRTALARWMTSPEHPLTARVMVNRIWQHHFGQGLVGTPNDFGELGERPTHPELLDWLAHEFVARGWSVKAMHRLILGSHTWRQSSRGREDALAADATNSLLWRMSPRRLGAEEVRDGMLAIAGLLNLEQGGPSVFGRMPAAALATSSTPDKVWGVSPPEQQNRRTLYVKVKRSLLTPFLVAHDMADVDASCPARFTTILPTQALQLLNGAFAHELARAFADRLEREVPDAGTAAATREGRVRRALSLALARPATDEEAAGWCEYLFRELESGEQLGPRRALELFCLTVLNLNEVVFVD